MTKYKEYNNKYDEKTRIEKQKLYKKIGRTCFICGSTKVLSCHQKNCKPHREIANLTFRQVQKENPNDYVRLCFKCHYGVHWAFNYLGLSWENIKEQLKCSSGCGLNPYTAIGVVI